MQRIVLEKVSKRFRIGFNKNLTGLARLLSFFSGRESTRVINALKDVSFSADSGEIIGVIGKNGSGKSTLLRVIAGIYPYDKGCLRVNGKVVSLIGLGAGLKPRLTMKDNIFLVGSIFGLSQKSIKKNFDSITGFAGLEKYVNTKVYQFSEGMKQRLAFSIAIHSNPEILLVDEVFEVGDEEFKRKSADKIVEMVKKGATVILVSHDLSMIEKYCSRTILLDNGKIIGQGKTEDVVKDYV